MGSPKNGSLAPRKPDQLPLWPDELRGVPWAALRSALFAPVRPGSRAALQREEIASVGEYQIVYTGWRLDQADLDVFENILHLARTDRLGKVIRFNSRDLLKLLGRSTGKSQRDWLLRSLSRLAACEIEIRNGTLTYAGSLIQEQGRDEVQGMHYILLNPRLGTLFSEQWSAVRWEQRQLLGRNHLAKWLHGFVAGQSRPLTFRIETIAKLSNSHYERHRDFRSRLSSAAKAVNKAGVDLEIFWSDNGTKVLFTRTRWRPKLNAAARSDSDGA